jgi:hypothetical protein
MEVDRLEYYIGERLKNLTDINVYNKKTPDLENIFPYLVYKLNACNYLVRHRKDWTLEIDYWQDSNDDTDILESASNVKNGVGEVVGLNNSSQNETEGFYQCHIDFEGNIPDTEQNISRYNQRFILKVD